MTLYLHQHYYVKQRVSTQVTTFIDSKIITGLIAPYNYVFYKIGGSTLVFELGIFEIWS